MTRQWSILYLKFKKKLPFNSYIGKFSKKIGNFQTSLHLT